MQLGNEAGQEPEEEDESGQTNIQVGDVVDVFLEQTEDSNGHVVLSREKAERMKVWDEIECAYREGRVVKGRVIERIKGGLAVDIGVRAFLPGSQIDLRPVRNLDSLRGEEFEMRVIKVNKKRGNIVLSRKAVLEESIKEGIITRNLNPRWIEGMLKHKHHGAQKVTDRVENLLGMAATASAVDNWVWEKSYERYIEDQSIKNALIENNRFAMMDMINIMLQAQRRGYWETDQERIDNLKRLYLELENWVEKKFE